MELTSIRISQYVNGFVVTGYDRKGMSIMDGESKPNHEDAVNSLIRAINDTEKDHIEGISDHNCPQYGRCEICGGEVSDNDCSGDML